ncbi:MAG TPA: hypothetical protein VLA19_17250 [Herpetosiphonaceae bacterium]|nr:hypothetical protein [Herpetosiphonaceae bacterium]
MQSPRTALLTIVQTSPGCISYRLIPVDDPKRKPVWATRSFAGDPRSAAGARSRMMLWARRNNVQVVDDGGAIVVEAVVPVEGLGEVMRAALVRRNQLA